MSLRTYALLALIVILAAFAIEVNDNIVSGNAVNYKLGARFTNAPTGLQAIAGSNSIILSWKPVSNANKYRVYRSYSNNGVFIQLGYTSRTTYGDYNLAPGGTYYYKVTSVSSYGVESQPSDIIVAQTLKPTVPSETATSLASSY